MLEKLIPLVGRRVDYIHRQYTRQWDEVLGAVLWGERHFTIDEQEYRALKAMNGTRTVRDVIATMNGSANNRDCFNKIRRLAKRGIVDLTEPAD